MFGRRAASVIVALMLLQVAAFAGSGTSAAGSAVALTHGPRTRPLVALTFDDGASPENCRRILAELVTRDVPATFFPIAEAMRLDPELWRLVAEAGDPIGDHTLTHPQMPALGYAAQLRQIRDARALIESITGRPMLDVFRPPYGAFDATTQAAAAAAGFPTLLTWDTSDRDTSPTGTVAHMLDAAELGKNGSVVLLHCGPNATPTLVPEIIDYYRGRGFRFVTVPELLGIPWDPGTTSTPTPDEILGGLTPLPPKSTGGTVVGPNGWTNPPQSPSPRPPTTPAPTASPSATPFVVAVSPGRTPAPSEPATASLGTPASMVSSGGGTASGAGPTSQASPAAEALAALAVLVVAVLAVVVLLAARALRRR